MLWKIGFHLYCFASDKQHRAMFQKRLMAERFWYSIARWLIGYVGW